MLDLWNRYLYKWPNNYEYPPSPFKRKNKTSCYVGFHIKVALHVFATSLILKHENGIGGPQHTAAKEVNEKSMMMFKNGQQRIMTILTIW